MEPCRFCTLTETPFVLTTHFSAVLDQNPVSKGHSMLILKRHQASIFGITTEEWVDLQNALAQTKKYLDSEFSPDGYNIGVNVGEAGGQSVPHLHVHIFPRYVGDVEKPRGGIRHFMKPIKELPEAYS